MLRDIPYFCPQLWAVRTISKMTQLYLATSTSFTITLKINCHRVVCKCIAYILLDLVFFSIILKVACFYFTLLEGILTEFTAGHTLYFTYVHSLAAGALYWFRWQDIRRLYTSDYLLSFMQVNCTGSSLEWICNLYYLLFRLLKRTHCWRTRLRTKQDCRTWCSVLKTNLEVSIILCYTL